MRKRTRTRRRKSTKTRRRQRGGEKKCLFINWGPGIGLGNQLCIYAAAVIIKNHLKNWDLCIPPAEANPHTKTDYRFLFKQGRPIEKTGDIANRIAVATLLHKNKDIRHGKWKNVDLVQDSGNELNDPGKNLRLKTTQEPEGGYYHNYESIAPAIPVVRPEVQAELDSRYGATTPIENPDTSAFIHIRYGDYKTYNINAPIDYYKAAKARLFESPVIKTIYLISEAEGIKWATSEGLAEGTTPIDDQDELKVLYIMSQCKAGACISASTFSLWGAILGPGTNDAAVITYPSVWIKMSPTELSLPSSWIQI